MSNLLIIGGTGFFGKSFLHAFERGILDEYKINEIIVTGRSICNNFQEKKGIKILKYDGSTDKTIPDADYMIYAASTSRPNVYSRDNIQKEVEQQKKNINNFYESIVRKKSIKKILYTSSGSVYGNKNLINYKTNEDIECMPDDNSYEKSGYSKIKLQWEDFINENLKSKSVIARCFAFIGLYLPRDKHFILGNFLNNYLKNEPMDVHNNSMVFRSYMHADDLINWLMQLLILKTNVRNIIYNVGSEEEIEMHELANKLNLKLGLPIKNYQFINKIDRYIPNTKKASNELNLKQKYNFDDALDQVINELKNNIKLYD